MTGPEWRKLVAARPDLFCWLSRWEMMAEREKDAVNKLTAERAVTAMTAWKLVHGDEQHWLEVIDYEPYFDYEVPF